MYVRGTESKRDVGDDITTQPDLNENEKENASDGFLSDPTEGFQRTIGVYSTTQMSCGYVYMAQTSSNHLLIPI